MEKLYIVCVDDQQEVLNSLEQDLEQFDTKMNVEVADSANEAFELMEDIDAAGDFVALIISDQVMPGVTGVEYLARVQEDPRFDGTQKMLLTGQATHQDTIEAINVGGIGNYVSKPWNREELAGYVKAMLTRYIFSKGLDHMQYQDLLDQKVVLEEMRRTTR